MLLVSPHFITFTLPYEDNLESMKNEFRIDNSELLAEAHFPVKAIFDMVPDCRFKDVIISISRNIGFGENYGACVFWEDLDEYDKQNTRYFEGAEFGLHNGDEVIITPKELLYYLRIICGKYCREHPEDLETINNAFEAFKCYNHVD